MISKLKLSRRSLSSQRMTLLKQMRKNRPQISIQSKQLLVDVSAIIQEDAHTGIQRVVRALLVQLFANPPEGYHVLPVFCTREHGYRYADSVFVHKFTSYDNSQMPIADVVVNNKDIFFGLDLVARFLPLHKKQLLNWKLQGVKLHILVYDMLPHLHPEWFTSRSVKNFHRWLRTISVYGDQLICISNSVNNELREWLCNQNFSIHTPRIVTIPLGCEIASSMPSSGMDDQIAGILESLKKQKFILMVGTIEPRKGYDDALKAMKTFWDSGEDIALVIVGKTGWKTVKLQERLLSHPQQGFKLFWLKNVSDQVLQKLYEMANVVLVTSYGEGFGLPIAEAIYYAKPLLVRDIPVFREVVYGYKNIEYFSDDNMLVSKLKSQLQNPQKNLESEFHGSTWYESVLRLNALFLTNQQKSSFNG
jgi:glycosyltransferase involved in cell wall biosynthesis